MEVRIKRPIIKSPPKVRKYPLYIENALDWWIEAAERNNEVFTAEEEENVREVLAAYIKDGIEKRESCVVCVSGSITNPESLDLVLINACKKIGRSIKFPDMTFMQISEKSVKVSTNGEGYKKIWP